MAKSKDNVLEQLDELVDKEPEEIKEPEIKKAAVPSRSVNDFFEDTKNKKAIDKLCTDCNVKAENLSSAQKVGFYGILNEAKK
jgi:hypothetical protein